MGAVWCGAPRTRGDARSPSWRRRGGEEEWGRSGLWTDSLPSPHHVPSRHVRLHILEPGRPEHPKPRGALALLLETVRSHSQVVADKGRVQEESGAP